MDRECAGLHGDEVEGAVSIDVPDLEHADVIAEWSDGARVAELRRLRGARRERPEGRGGGDARQEPLVQLDVIGGLEPLLSQGGPEAVPCA